MVFKSPINQKYLQASFIWIFYFGLQSIPVDGPRCIGDSKIALSTLTKHLLATCSCTIDTSPSRIKTYLKTAARAHILIVAWMYKIFKDHNTARLVKNISVFLSSRIHYKL